MMFYILKKSLPAYKMYLDLFNNVFYVTPDVLLMYLMSSLCTYYVESTKDKEKNIALDYIYYI